MSKSCAILQSSYIPWKGYFDMINLVDEFILYDCVQFTRRDWRNRNKIKAQHGLKWLTIPVDVKGNYLARIDEMRTVDPDWARSHWEALRHNYVKTAHFADYKDVFENAYLSMNTTNLSDINLLFLKQICEVLGIETKLTTSTDYKLEGDKNMRLVNLCLQAGADTYLSGPAAKSYVDENLFKEHGIDVKWMSYDGYPEYRQLFPPFEHGVTVLDLIFNEGPAATKYMNSFACAKR